jgi:thiamine pyrophosphokinase
VGESFSYVIEQISDVDSPHLPGMVKWLNQVFPEYDPYFGTILTRLRREDGRHQAQIFVGLCGDQVVGLVQVFYCEWQHGLIADVDLLGVLEPYRRSGLGSALVRQAILATRDMSSRYGLPAIGVVSLADPEYSPVIRLHQKLGGQIRTDLRYRGGDVIVWYPLSEHFSAIETKALAWQLWQFGGLPEEEFISQYGKPQDLEHQRPDQRVVIIANGAAPDEATVRRWLPRDERTQARLICADGGARTALALDLKPEAVVGDLDSLDAAMRARLRATGCRFVVYPAAKDWTDLELALRLAVEEGATEIVVLGALGGRLDQELANILLLFLPELQDIPTRIVDDRQEMFVARGQAEIAGRAGDIVSLIPLGGDVQGIVTEGLLYPLRDEPLVSGPARGISNVMTAQVAHVTLRSGTLLIVHSHS